jgi:ribose transport system substrate-binding protein
MLIYLKKAILVLLMCACSMGYAWAGQKTIGVCLLTRVHQFYHGLESGMQSEADKRGYTLVVTAGEYDPAKQAAQMDKFISNKVDAIILAPCDSKAMGSSIVQANKANIPVFTVDIANLSSQGKVISHISSDNKEGGRQAALLLAQALSGKGKVVIINHPGITSVLDRVAGFKEAMMKFPDIQIIADVPAWGQRDRAMAIMEDILLQLPDVNGVFGINDDCTLGALAATEAAGKKIMIVGYDATPEAKKAIAEGRIYGDAIQYPVKIGSLAIQTIASYFAGKKVPEVVPVPVGTWTKDSK